MTIKNKTKRNLILMLTMFAILLSVITPTILVLADDDDANAKYNKAVSDYLGDAESMTDVVELIKVDKKVYPKPTKNTMPHVMKRLFNAGEYINDVEEGVLSNQLNVTKSDILYNNRYACNPNAPNNLLNHNCNIPNFTTGLIQNFAYPFTRPFNNAEKTSSYATFGFGVPNQIPGGVVPVNPGNRQHTYTALELYGYDLKLTSYNGEWDRIVVSNEARMLSNFGIIDSITLVGTSLWNAVQGGVAALIENFSFNPLRWIQNYGNALDGYLSGGINTVLDTSDLNIVATNKWLREGFNNTLYNVYVMSDKEILTETTRQYFATFTNTMGKNAELSPELQEALALSSVPSFTFKPDWETEESIKARASANSTNASESAKAEADPNYTPNTVSVPDPVYYTEKEQLGFWAEDNSSYLARGAAQGLISSNPDDYESYDDIVDQWNTAYEAYFSREFDASGEVVTKLLEKSDAEVFLENPHLDPKQPISHYACADSNGNMMRKSDGTPEYLYLKHNKGSQEFLNPKCSKVRSPIGGALLGSGWETKRPADTRYRNNVSDDFIGASNQSFNLLISSNRSLNSFLAKITNTMLGLAFKPILSELGIDVIVSELVSGFRDTVFFPFAALVAAIGAIVLFMKVLRSGSVIYLFSSLFATLLIFIIGTTFLLHPTSTVNLVDKMPTAIDNFLAQAILVDDEGTDYCSTGTEKDGIRSAQCNVWGAMVFNPWVHLQFGTGYDHLYANGYAPAEGSSFKNTNADLVGDAKVYMGGGKYVNNWAMYQLDKTKAGTINSQDTSAKQRVGTVDKDMYKLVDLQAGPNNGAGTDSRYFNTWNGAIGADTGVVFLTTIQSILMTIVIIGLSFNKVEASFMFAISVIFLPFMLLAALLPQGKNKLKGYLSNLVGLLLKRAVIVLMIGVMLKAQNSMYAQVDSIMQAAIISIAISTAFLVYKKELIKLITSTNSGLFNDTGDLKNMIATHAPLSVKQSYQKMSMGIKGAISGFAGGAGGYVAAKRDIKNEKNKLKSEFEKLEKQERKTGLNDVDRSLKDKLESELKNMELTEITHSEKNNILSTSFKSAINSSFIIGRQTERSIRRKGYSIDKVFLNAHDDVVNRGADAITNKDEPTAQDTFREVLSHTQSNKTQTVERKISIEEARILRKPKIQKEVRRLAKEREKLNNTKDENYKATTPNLDEVQKVADKIDKTRNRQKVKGYMSNPFAERKFQKNNEYSMGKVDDFKAKVEDIKEKILNEVEYDENESKNNSNENTNKKGDEQ